MNFPPVVIFGYNRPHHLEKVITALKRNVFFEYINLFFFIDGPKDNEDVMKQEKIKVLLDNVTGFKSVNIKFRKVNIGLSKNIIDGVTEVISDYSRVIVLEDDIVVNKYFFEYMSRCLDIYESREDILSITGYNNPPRIMKIPRDYLEEIYLNPRPCSWGWGTWEQSWKEVNWEKSYLKEKLSSKRVFEKFKELGEDIVPWVTGYLKGDIDSWAINWTFYHFEKKGFCVYPVKSLVNNIGHDRTGTNTTILNRNKYWNELKDFRVIEINEDILPNKGVIDSYFKEYKGIYVKIKNVIKKLLMWNKLKIRLRKIL